MEFQKIVNLLDTTSDNKDLPRFVNKKWIEVYDQSGENYNVNKEIRIITPRGRNKDLKSNRLFKGIISERFLFFL